MPDARDLLQRWSRRKRAAGDAPEATQPEPGEPVEDREHTPDLPAIDELGPDSDYAAFMRKNVPPALRRAALRRAWSTTPAIAGHRPLVEYDWDVHAPGFGKLWPVDEPARLAAALLAGAKGRQGRPIEPAEPPAEPGSEEADRQDVADRAAAPRPEDVADTEAAPAAEPGQDRDA